VIGYSDFHDADPMMRILLPVYLELYFLLCLELQLLTGVKCYVGEFGGVLPW
jgi:hypothetical protein